MRARAVPLLLLVLAVLLVGASIWSALSAEVRGDTRCGPLATQANVDEAACDAFYDRRYVQVGATLGLGLTAWAAASIVERQQQRRTDRVTGRRTDRFAAR